MTARMGLRDSVSYVFATYLNWLDEHQCRDLVSYARSGGEPETADWIERVLHAQPEEVRKEMTRPGDDEDRLPWVNNFLRLQKLGRITRDQRADLIMNSIADPWLVHRQAGINGYPSLLEMKLLTLSQPSRKSSYSRELNWLLKAYARSEELQDDDYYSFLCMLLNVALPATREESLWAQAAEYFEFLLTNKDEPFLAWLSPTNFLVLAHDLGIKPNRLIPVFGPLVTRRPPGLSDYLAWILGIRMLGEPAREILKGIKPIGGMRLLEIVSGRFKAEATDEQEA